MNNDILIYVDFGILKTILMSFKFILKCCRSRSTCLKLDKDKIGESIGSNEDVINKKGKQQQVL